MKLLDISSPKYPNEFTLVDDEDFEFLNQWKWHKNNENYVSRLTKDGETVRLHRVVMNTPKDMECDHIDRNGLNNQKSNLRNCTHAENMRNSNRSKSNTSGYRGVFVSGKYWMAKIIVMGRQIYLGSFRDIEDAARAYDVAALKYHKEFAILNFPKENYGNGDSN